MKAAQVRSTFLDFFAERGHAPVASSSLVPAGDPTLMFTAAGMVQFKDVFTGAEVRPYKRATTSQKCVRAGGKHNDLDEVGKTPRHHTFFEMLGNFSFGDYFKEDAIAWAWQLLTSVYGIDQRRLVVTVFGGEDGLGPDDEARALWKRVTGFGDDRIIGLGKKENFWAAGDTGPMGPCSEIHYFMDGAPGAWPTTDPASWGGWLEIWNLVFMQYERSVKDGPLNPLPAPSIDTGAGLERMSSVLQGVGSNYDTDLFTGILAEAAGLAGIKYGEDPRRDTSLRVIADHARASTFLIADGVFPDKVGKEYVLRRIFRRAVRHGKLLGIEAPFMHAVCGRVIEEMKSVYPDLAAKANTIASVTLEEEKRFRATLDRGLDLLEDEFTKMRGRQASQIAGKTAFTLSDTYGFPYDLTEIIAGDHGFTVDKDGFERELTLARERSGSEGAGEQALDAAVKALAGTVGATRFLGYGHETDGRGTSGTGTVVALLVDGGPGERAAAGARVAVVLDQTPFYGESGGQIGDTGVLTTAAGAEIRIDDTQKPAGDVVFHRGVVTAGTIAVGDQVTAVVDDGRRDRVRANHSATHLLHHALRRVLGDHVAQKGSLVEPDRLRFDFAHFSPMTAAQKREVEDLVNAEIRRNHDSHIEVLPIDQARARGAMAMFGEKYGATVRVVQIGHQSLELCGGTHVRRAGDIGLFKLVGESGVAQGVRRIEAVTGAGALAYVRQLEDELALVRQALNQLSRDRLVTLEPARGAFVAQGVRRIEAVTGAGALAYVRQLEDELGRVGERLRAAPLEVADRVERLQAGYKALEKEHDKLKQKLAAGAGGRDLLSEVVDIGGVKALLASIDADDPKVLRATGDALRDKLGSGVLVLAGVGGDKVSLIAMVTPDLIKRLPAGKLLGVAAEVLGGRGGGKPDLAQGAGKDPTKIPEALAAVRTWIAAQP